MFTSILILLTFHQLCSIWALPTPPDGSSLTDLCQKQYFKSPICQDLLRSGDLDNNVLCELFCGTGINIESCHCDETTETNEHNTNSTDGTGTYETTTPSGTVFNTTLEVPANTTAWENTTTMSTSTTTTAITTTKITTTTTSICHLLCKDGLGGALCECEGQPPARNGNSNSKGDVSWEELCSDLCRDGQGGALCQCEGLPPAKQGINDQEKEHSSNVKCHFLCASGYTGSLCNCYKHVPKEKSLNGKAVPSVPQLPVGPPLR